VDHLASRYMRRAMAVAIALTIVVATGDPAKVSAGGGGVPNDSQSRLAGQLSAEFLRLETAAEDSTRVERLSAGATELRDRFNRDRSHVRLVMLLSPT